MHTISELAAAAKKSNSTVIDTLRAEGVPYTEKTNPRGGKPQKLYHITLEEFRELQAKRRPGKKVEVAPDTSGIDALLGCKWARRGETNQEPSVPYPNATNQTA